MASQDGTSNLAQCRWCETQVAAQRLGSIAVDSDELAYVRGTASGFEASLRSILDFRLNSGTGVYGRRL